MTETELSKLKTRKRNGYLYCEISCSTCQKKIWKRKGDIKRRKNCFCSSDCLSLFFKCGSNIPCKICGKEVYRMRKDLKKSQNIFCSHTCAAVHNNNGIRRHGNPRGTCKICGKEKSRSASKYCSNNCHKQNIYEEYIERWLNGKEKGNSGEAVSRHIRKYLFEKHENKCQVCGWGKVNESTQKIPLNINHYDGNWKNNNINNLQLLCPNCHSLTNNYGALNKGNGRPYRKNKRRLNKDN